MSETWRPKSAAGGRVVWSGVDLSGLTTWPWMAASMGLRRPGERVPIVGDAMGILEGVASFLGFRSRSLTEDGVSAATGVFETTIPYRRVIIDDWCGAGGAPYTMPGPG